MSQGDHYAYGEPGVNAGSRGCKARGFQCSRSLSNSRLRPKSLDIPCSDSCKDTVAAVLVASDVVAVTSIHTHLFRRRGGAGRVDGAWRVMIRCSEWIRMGAVGTRRIRVQYMWVG